MNIVNKIPKLKQGETVFIHCVDIAPELYNVKSISKKPNKLFIIFEHTQTKVKLGIKIREGVVLYSKFNKTNGCETILNITSTHDSDDFKRFSFENDHRVKVKLEKKFLINPNADGLQVTSAHYKINKVETTIKKAVKKHIKKLIEIDKVHRGFVELLNHTCEYPNDVQKTAQLFIDMYPTKESLLETQKIINMEYRPILENLKNQNFHLTNISPIVIDRKKIFTNDNDDQITMQHSNNNLKNSFVEKSLNKLYSETTLGEGDIGDLALTLNISREFSKGSSRGGSVKSYLDYIRKIYGNPSTNLETKINSEFSTLVDNKNIRYDPPNLNYIAPDKSMIEHKYYKVNLAYTNDVIRFSHKSADIIKSACAVPTFTPDKKMSKLQLTHREGNQITKRKSTSAIYYFKDVFDDIKIGKTKTCNGTNKSGDVFYLGQDFKSSELTKSQSVPPQKIAIYEGEQVYVCGFYIKSPNNSKNLIFGGHEQYDLKNNSKIYPSLFSNYKTVLDLDDPIINSPVKIIDNINNFASSGNYDPNSDYFILVGDIDVSQTRSKLTKEQWYKNLEKVSPTLQEIMTIIKPQLGLVKSVMDVEKILNKYYFTFSKFPNTPYLNDIKSTITRNIDQSYNKIKSHHRNYLNLKNQSDILNTLYYKLKHSNGVDFKFLEFFNDYTLKTIIHKDLLSKLYTFLEGRPAPTSTNVEDSIMSIINTKFIKGFKGYGSDRADQLNKFLDKIPKQSLKFQNISFSKIILEEVLDIINSKEGYLNREILSNILELDNLYKIMDIIQNEEARYDIELEEHILSMESDINGLINSYDDQREIQNDYLRKCKGVRIVKSYSSASELSKENGVETYRDLKYDTLYYDMSVLFGILQSPASMSPDGNYTFKIVLQEHVDNLTNQLRKNYIFVDNETINKKLAEILECYENIRINPLESDITAILDLLDNFDNSRKKRFAGLTINGLPLRNKIVSDDIAFLVDGKKEFLFKRSGGVWHIITEDEFQETPKAFLFSDKNILKLKSEELESLFLRINPSAVASEDNCVNIDNYTIPIEIYRVLGDISYKRGVVKSCKTIVNYKNFINTRVTKQLKLIENLFSKQLHRKQRFSIPHTTPLVRRKSTIPKSILLRYKDLFDGGEFDVTITKVIEFAENFGVDYCIADGCEETEKSSKTSKFIYYNSSAFVFPICCKHEMCYKDISLKSNTERASLLEQIKSDFGVTEEDRCVCKLCGKDIDFLKGNSFEGFDGGDRLVVFREAEEKESDPEIELYEEDISIKNEKEFYNKYQKSPEIMAIKYILSELGIKIIKRDLDYIISKCNTISISELYKGFIKTDFIKKIMINSYRFLKSLKAGSKTKHKKSGGLVGGSNTDVKLTDTIVKKISKSKFFSKFAKYADDTIDMANLETVFSDALKIEIANFNSKNPTRVISMEDVDMLKNIGDINQLLVYLNDSPTSNGAVILLLSNIQKFFNMYIRGFKFLHGLKYVTVLLQFSLPEYTINPFTMLSKIPALRASGKSYLIQNLYHNQQYIIDSIFSIMENTIQNKSKSKTRYLNKIIAIFKTIIGLSLKFAVVPKSKKKSTLRKIMFLNNMIIFEPLDLESINSKKGKSIEIKKYFIEKLLKELGNLIIQDPYIAGIKAERVKYEYERSLGGGFTYDWLEFRPVINTETLQELDLQSILEVPVMFSSTTFALNAQLSKLSENYIFYMNKLLNIIDSDSSFYSYTNSTAFTNINVAFEDYFDINNFTELKIKYPNNIDEDPDRKEAFDSYLAKIKILLERMKAINDIIGSKRREFKSPIYLLDNNNFKTRDLQEYTNFKILSTDKPAKYFLNKIKKFYTTYYITKENLLLTDKSPITKRRIFKTIKDPNHHIIKTLLERKISRDAVPYETGIDGASALDSGEMDMVDEYMQLIGGERNIITSEILRTQAKGLTSGNNIFFSGESNGVYEVDILTGEFKSKINFNLDHQYGTTDVIQLKEIIKIIESKMYAIRPNLLVEPKFNSEANFKTNYLQTIDDISSLIKTLQISYGESSIIQVTELRNIISFYDTDISDLVGYWSELSSMKFAVTAGYIRETVSNTLDSYQKTMFIEIFEQPVDKMDKFFVEKFQEIESDLKIILFEENEICQQLLENEFKFYSHKQETDKASSTNHIFKYLLKFLISKSLAIYRRYTNSIQKHACAGTIETTIPGSASALGEPADIGWTSLDKDNLSIMLHLYRSRYTESCVEYHHTTDHLEQFTVMCTGIIYLLGLTDSGIKVQYRTLLLKDLIIKVMYLLSLIFRDTPEIMVNINLLFFEEISSIFETFKTNEYEIKNYMNIKKTKGNQNRKRRFDKKTDEDKRAHKLYRRFNLGKILDLSDNANDLETTVETPVEESSYDTSPSNLDL